jgi:hypothetical protein
MKSSGAESLPRWDDDAFRQKIAGLAAKRGLSVTGVCKAAGLSASYLAKSAGRSGRSIEAILSIAEVLDVSLLELVDAANKNGAAPSEENLARLTLVAEIAARLYVALGARPGLPADVNVSRLLPDILAGIENAS